MNLKKDGLLIGTVLLIAGAAIVLPGLLLLGAPKIVAAIGGLGVATAGFCIQMYSAFATKWDFERDIRQRQADHEALLQEVRGLPPAEAIAKLLGSISSQ